jgi:hypothetical protein
MSTLREYLALAIAAIPSVNRQDFRHAFQVATSTAQVKPVLQVVQHNQLHAYWGLNGAWGDLWAKPGWDVQSVITAGKEYARVSLRTRTFPLRVVRAGVDAMMARLQTIREGNRRDRSTPRVFIQP